MSYARFAKDESDVYVFLCVSGNLECCGCSLAPNGWGFRVLTTQEMLDHLAEHKRAGHLVPDRCIERLTEERESIDARIAEIAALDSTHRPREVNDE